jgi:hypothetical protein
MTDTEQIWYSQSRIHRSQLQNNHSPYPNFLVYFICYYEHNSNTKASLNANAFETSNFDWYYMEE